MSNYKDLLRNTYIPMSPVTPPKGPSIASCLEWSHQEWLMPHTSQELSFSIPCAMGRLGGGVLHRVSWRPQEG